MKKERKGSKGLEGKKSGIGAAEIILAFIVLIILALVFRLQIQELAAAVFERMLSESAVIPVN